MQKAFEERYFQTGDGLRLYARDYGHAIGQNSVPIVCLPGLSRNARDFHHLALRLSGDPISPRRVIAFDYRGRGNSDRDDDKSRYTVAIEMGDVIAGCAALAVDKAVFIGTSRGGLILHVLAAVKPELIAAVVLNDIGPVIELGGLLAIREYLTAGNSGALSWEDAASRLRGLHGRHFPALEEPDWMDMAQAIYRQENGRLVPDFDPAIAAPLAALTTETVLPDLWAQFSAFDTMPLMTIRGEFSNILSESTLAEMGRRHRKIVAITADGQGHAPMLHLGGLETTISAFIAQHSIA